MSPFRNPHRHQTPDGWFPSDEPPPLKSRVEIQNNWGIRPWYGLYDYSLRGWCAADDCDRCVEAGPHLSWRWPTSNANYDPATYTDPTDGAQETPEYWLEASPTAPDYRRFTTGPLARRADIPPSETPAEAADAEFPIVHSTPPSDWKLLTRTLLQAFTLRTNPFRRRRPDR